MATEANTDIKPTAAEIIAVVLSLVWLLACGVFLMLLPSDSEGGALRFVLTMLAVFMPVAMIWVAAAAARSARIMRDESRRLHAAIDGMREVVLADRRERNETSKPEVEKTLRELAQSAKQTETALATFASVRTRPVPRPTGIAPETPSTDQPALALGTQVEDIAQPLDNADLIRALNFPNDAQDSDGFAAMRRSLKHRPVAQLIQAAQDVLTLMSQDGIYMDDLRPDRARPEFWRRFAQGERGADVAPLGGVRDRSSLALSAGRMREDTIFRDAAHHFLRKFDLLLAKVEPDLSDEELMALSDTRTARAFMLLGRVTGAFD